MRLTAGIVESEGSRVKSEFVRDVVLVYEESMMHLCGCKLSKKVGVKNAVA